MSNNQIVSIWIGKNAQHYAHHFYNLRAQQFFNQQQDPINHKSIWKDQNKKIPRALIFDTQIQNLNRIRDIDRKKMIKKMQKMQTVQFGEGTDYMSLLGLNSFPNQFKISNNIDPLQLKNNKSKQHKISPIFANWQIQEKNYMLINKQFHTGKQSFTLWEALYNREQQIYDDKIRKQLQNTDYLRGFTFCSDDNNAGFTHRMLQNLRDQCPKTNILFMSLRASEQQTQNISLVSSISQILQKVDIFIPYQQLIPQNSYFKVNTNFYQQQKQFAFVNHLTPLMDSIFTPLCLKDAKIDNYFNQIVSHNQNIFNCCYTLPYIYSKTSQQNQYDEQQQEQRKNFEKMTNLFRYADGVESQEFPNMLNFLNVKNAFSLNIKNGKFISQSYVLKGHGLKLEENFKPKCELLSLKYLQGILSKPQQYQCWPQISYNDIYQKRMRKQVSSYPFYSVLFSHECFGQGIRKLGFNADLEKKHKQQMYQLGWRQKLFEIGDKYLEDKKGNESDD